MSTTALHNRRELAHRQSDGFDVTLFWIEGTDEVAIAVLDSRSGEALQFEVDGHNALDAFNHPYAYAATEPLRVAALQSVAATR